MKKISVPCDFGGAKAPVTLYIGEPEAQHHPISFQANWLAKERGGNIPQEVMDSLTKLMNIALKNNIPFGDLCEYALYSVNTSTSREYSTPQVDDQTDRISSNDAFEKDESSTASAENESEDEDEDEDDDDYDDSIDLDQQTEESSTQSNGIRIATTKIAVPVED